MGEETAGKGEEEEEEEGGYHAHSASPRPDHLEEILLAVTKMSSLGTLFLTCVSVCVCDRGGVRIELCHMLKCGMIHCEVM
jgi:hypothetical protein